MVIKCIKNEEMWERTLENTYFYLNFVIIIGVDIELHICEIN